MNKIHKQYVLTVYTDGTFRFTERKPAEQCRSSRDLPVRRTLMRASCVARGTLLNIFTEEVA